MACVPATAPYCLCRRVSGDPEDQRKLWRQRFKTASSVQGDEAWEQQDDGPPSPTTYWPKHSCRVEAWAGRA